MSKTIILTDPIDADEAVSTKPAKTKAAKAPNEVKVEKVSERSDTVKLVRDYEQSKHEKNLEEQIAITKSWKHIETLLADEANNAWSLGDEFSTLVGLKLTIREIADKVVRGKSYVDALASTSQLFPPTTRDKSFTWFNHDLLRRAVNAVANRLPDEASALHLKGHLSDCLAAIRNAKARTTKDAVTPFVEVLVKEKLIDEETAKVVSSPEAKTAEMQLFIGTGKAHGSGRPLRFLEIRTKPAKGEDLYSGFKLSKLAWRKASMSDNAEDDGKRLIVVPIIDGKPGIDEPTATLLLAAVKGDAKALEDFAKLAAQDLT